MRNQSLSQKIIKGSFLVVALTFLSSVFSYLNRFFYSRVLSVEMYGLFYAGLGLVNTIWTFNDLGFGYSTTYLLPKYLKKNKYLLVWNVYKYGQIIQVTVSVLASLVIFLFASDLANNYFKVPGSEIMIYMFCAYLVANSLLTSLIQFFIGAQKEIYYSSIVLSRTILVIIFSIVFWYMGKTGATYFALAWAMSYFATAGVFLYFLRTKFSFLGKQKISWDSKLLKKMAGYALPTIVTTLIGAVASSGDVFFLTLYRGVRDVGIYNIIFPLASTSAMLLLPLSYLFMPLVSHLMEGEKKKVELLVGKILEVVPFAVLYIALFLSIFPSDSIRLLFGAKWLGVADKILGPLSMGYILSMAGAFLGTVVLGAGKVKERLNATILVTIASVPVNMFLIKRFGISGTVVSYIILSLFTLLMLLRIIKQVVAFTIPYTFYVKLFIGSLTIYIGFKTFGTGSLNLTTFLLTGVAYSVIYLFFGYVLRIYDIKTIKQLLGRTV